MKRSWFLPVVTLLLAACSNDGMKSEHIPSPVSTSFAPGAGNEIEVSVTDRLPAQRVDLVAPDGRVYIAYRIDRDRIVEPPAGSQPNLGVGVFGGSSSRVRTGVGIGFPLGGFERPAAPAQVQSLALIHVEDMAAYRAGWQAWRIRIELGNPPATVRHMEVPAPPPPS